MTASKEEGLPNKKYYSYRTAMEGAVDVIELSSLLHCIKHNKPHGDIRTIIERLEHFGVYDNEYEFRIARLRNIIEDAYQFMTLNTWKQKVPTETLRNFQSTMGEVSAIVRRNRNDRKDDLDRRTQN